MNLKNMKEKVNEVLLILKEKPYVTKSDLEEIFYVVNRLYRFIDELEDLLLW